MLRHNLKKLYSGRYMSSLVEFTVNNTARRVTLNRPNKLNALNLEMCKAIVPTLQEYRKSDVNSVVILDSSCSPRAFCAGGDVAAVAEASYKGDKSVSHEFFKYEYSLNWLLAAYPKPIVAIMDGITMGGGVGLSIHVPFRIATENTKWAMPEMDIGLYPDVGVTFALPKITTVGGSDGQFAYYLCLTGDIVSGLDAYIAGLASHYISSEAVEDLKDRLGELLPSKDVNEMFESTNKAIMAFTSPIPSGYKFKYSNEALDVIEKVFRLDTPVSVLLQSLENISRSNEYSSEAKGFAADTRKKLLMKSPVSMEVAREQFRRNFFNDIQSAMKQDLITATNMSNQLELSEFAVSSKHKLILKNKTPYPWGLTDVSPSHVSRLISEDPSSSVSLLDVDAITFKKYLYHEKYHLPTENKVQSYITGTDQSGRSFAVTKPETIRYFTELNPISKGKPGVRELVSSILDRKCEVDREGFLTWKY